MGQIPQALEADPETFHLAYGFTKPRKDDLVVVYCQARLRPYTVLPGVPSTLTLTLVVRTKVGARRAALH